MLRGSHGRWTAAFLLTSLLTLGWIYQTLGMPTIHGLPEATPPTAPVTASVTPPDHLRGLPPAESTAPPPPLTTDPAPEQATVEQVIRPTYDFSQPAPESAPVDKSYFSDAAFVGDSRTDGFLIYSGIGGGKNLTSNGLSIFQLEEKKALTIKGQKYTLLEALSLEQYGKVYLSLGVNELGIYDDEGFYRSYCEAIDHIRAIQPNAVIYIQGLIPLNEELIAQTTGRTYLKNDHLRVYNDLMRKAAEEKQVVYLDLYSAFVGENEELPLDASRDGVHLHREYCVKWLDYLLVHTVNYDTLYPQVLPQEELPPEEPAPPAGA